MKISRPWIISLSVTTVILLLIILTVTFRSQLAEILNIAPRDAIVKVGDEYIFQQELDYETGLYPKTNITAEEVRSTILTKLKEDSVILQGAAEDDLITLDKSFYNGPDIDYKKRREVIKSVKAKIDNITYTMNGSMVTLWFFNNGVAPKGYDEAKRIAKDKMEDIYDQVVNGSLTMRAAADKLIADKSLEEIDSAYENNAYSTFKSTRDRQITLDPNFDKVLWETEENDFTPLYALVENSELVQNKEVAYTFAFIDTKDGNKDAMGYDAWLNSKKETIKVTEL